MSDPSTTTAATVAELEHTAIDADVAALVDEPWLQTLQELIDDYNDQRTTEVCRHEGGQMQADCWRHQLARTLVITRRSMYPLGSDVRPEATNGHE